MSIERRFRVSRGIRTPDRHTSSAQRRPPAPDYVLPGKTDATSPAIARFMFRTALFNSDHARTRSLTAAILCAALTGCGYGILMPLAALNLEAMTRSASVVGVNAAAAALSTLVATLLIPALLARIPPRLTLVASALIIAASFVAFPALPDPWIWFILRFVAGLAVTVIFVVSETWINQLAKPEARASLLAVYATVLSAGFGSGALLLAALGSQGWIPWLAGVAVFGVGALPVLILRGPELIPPSREKSGADALVQAARMAPIALVAALVFGTLETGIFSLLPVYARRLGFEETGVGLLVATGALGALCLQIPIGQCADRMGVTFTLRLVALSTFVLAIAIALVGSTVWMLAPLIFLFVGIASGFYTLGLSLLGARVKPAALASANSAFIFAYGIGSLIGPPLGGIGMDIVNPQGLMMSFAGFALLYWVISIAAKRR